MAIQKTANEARQEMDMAKHFGSRKKKVANKKKKRLNGYPDPSYLRNKSYTDFLNSKYWQMVRKAILKRDDYKCIICKNDKDLQVHHDTYKNHFNEHRHLEDLMTLCRKCHKEHHYSQL